MNYIRKIQLILGWCWWCWFLRCDPEFVSFVVSIPLPKFPNDSALLKSTLIATFANINTSNFKYKYACPAGVLGGTKYCQAQDREDLYAYLNYFYLREGGVMLESGALDGVLHSSSWFFEHYLNWKVVHIEADPTSYQQLCHNRPQAINIHAVLCKQDQIVHWVDSGSLGPSVHGIYEFMSPQYVKEVHAELTSSAINQSHLVEIKCQPASDLLLERGITHIDLWILDVEGAEQVILEGFDFTAVTVDVLCIECITGNAVNQGYLNVHQRLDIDQKLRYIREHGYECKYPFEATPRKTILQKFISFATTRNCWCVRNNVANFSSLSPSDAYTTAAMMRPSYSSLRQLPRYPTGEQLSHSTLLMKHTTVSSTSELLYYYCSKGLIYGTKYCQAQDREDLYAYLNYFYLREGGVMLESGALDGVLHSSSWFFEHYLNWKVVHIEADPTSYLQLCRNRPQAINIHAVLCQIGKTAHWVDTGDSTVRGVLESMSPAYKQHHHKEMKHRDQQHADYKLVNCSSASDLLIERGITHIDLWILDVEGAEQVVLERFDFTAVTVDVLCIECITTSTIRADDHILSTEEQARQIDNKLKYIRSQGYICQTPFQDTSVLHDTTEKNRKHGLRVLAKSALKRNCWCEKTTPKRSYRTWNPLTNNTQDGVIVGINNRNILMTIESNRIATTRTIMLFIIILLVGIVCIFVVRRKMIKRHYFVLKA